MKKTLTVDAWSWIGVMVLAAVIAFTLLKRDVQRNFGSLSFGSFPEFRIPTIDKGYLDNHLLKNRVWAVHAGSNTEELNAVAKRLSIIEKHTAAGKRHLYVLTLGDQATKAIDVKEPFHYVSIENGNKVLAYLRTLGRLTEDTVFLVDQNSVVRGKYHLNELQEFKNFQQDLLRIL